MTKPLDSVPVPTVGRTVHVKTHPDEPCRAAIVSHVPIGHVIHACEFTPSPAPLYSVPNERDDSADARKMSNYRWHWPEGTREHEASK